MLSLEDAEGMHAFLHFFVDEDGKSMYPCKTGPAQNERKIGGIRKRVVGKTAEWACTMDGWGTMLEFFHPNSAQIPLIWTDNSAQNCRSALPGCLRNTIFYLRPCM